MRGPEGIFFRVRSHALARVIETGLGLAVAWQVIEDLLVGHGRAWSGALFPWRRLVDVPAVLGEGSYPWIWGLQIGLVTLYLARVRVRWTAALLALVLFVENLSGFLNHKLVMVILLLCVSLKPAPSGAKRGDLLGRDLYFNIDLMRLQVSVIYITTALHKMNPQFLSGRTLENLFHMLQAAGLQHYPEPLSRVLGNPGVCLVLAWLTVALEILLGLFLNLRRRVGPLLVVALGLHLAFSLLMPWLWIFTFLMFVALHAFLPDRLPRGACLWRAARPPGAWSRLLLPGSLRWQPDEEISERRLVLPDGRELVGWARRVELLGLCPLTLVPAEILRSLPRTPRENEVP